MNENIEVQVSEPVHKRVKVMKLLQQEIKAHTGIIIYKFASE